MRYSAGAYTDIGSTRKNNQDSFCVLRGRGSAQGNVLMAVVCDGMGGLYKGEVASGTVVTAFSDWFTNDLPLRIRECSMRQMADIWMEMLYGLNERLRDYGRMRDIQVGTTFSGLFLMGTQYLWVHVGDSRIYLLREGDMRQLTTDHTVANRDRGTGMVKAGTENMLTQCIGVSMALKPDWGMGEMCGRDRFLLCSDGFYHRIRPSDLTGRMSEEIESGKQMANLSRELSRLMMERGEKDNVTAVLIGVKEDEERGLGVWLQGSKRSGRGNGFCVEQELTQTDSKEILR